jgi:hypothetical protein
MSNLSDALREQGVYFGNVDYLETAMHGLDLQQKHFVESIIIGCIAARTPNGTWHRVVDLAVKEVRGDA